MLAASPAALLAAVGALAWLGPPEGGSPMVASAQAVWTAWLNVTCRRPGSNDTGQTTVGESGVFGQDSPRHRTAGQLVAPDGRDGLDACSPLTNFSLAPASEPWLALIQRGGGCTFAEKIRLARHHGAVAAVIFNYPGGTGNDVQPMTHPAGHKELT
uniref:Uncharacterized protein n=1 Tax=Sphaerodactylus townsendi TaxID=933632 RepID=A0ACB8FXF8_9SAUR